MDDDQVFELIAGEWVEAKEDEEEETKYQAILLDVLNLLKRFC